MLRHFVRLIIADFVNLLHVKSDLNMPKKVVTSDPHCNIKPLFRPTLHHCSESVTGRCQACSNKVSLYNYGIYFYFDRIGYLHIIMFIILTSLKVPCYNAIFASASFSC